MGLSINQNIAAFNAYRNLSSTQGSLGKSLEKLSSGFRINRAADDAAGLAISEGLRSQVGGLKVAVRNSQDGISVAQTAEGALTETHAILQRMRDLSVQASNHGGLSVDAKNSIQKEMNQLTKEVTRIADTTDFNGTKLLNGNYNGTFQVGANVGTENTISVALSGTSLDAVGLGIDALDVTQGGNTTGVGTTAEKKAATGGTATFAWQSVTAGGTITVAGGGVAVTSTTTAQQFVDAYNAITVGSGAGQRQATASLDGTNITFTTTQTGAAVAAPTASRDAAAQGGLGATTNTTATSTTVGAAASGPTNTIRMGAAAGELNTATAGKLKIGNVTVDVDKAMSRDALMQRITNQAGGAFTVAAHASNTTDIVITSADPNAAQTAVAASHTSVPAAGKGAANAITAIDGAIKKVSEIRADLGAVQNRFEHTINNLNVAVENLSASESRIRDTDMASEMVNFTRNQILSQAGTAMLAQANQIPQGVLSLLR